jgi:archaellin
MKTVCVSCILVLCVVVLGCTTILPGPEGAKPVPSVPSTTASPVPTLTLPATGAIQLAGNVYGLSSDPSKGIDTITFSLGLPAHASPVDLTPMEIVFTTQGTDPVLLKRGTMDSTSIFTTTIGGNAVTELVPDEEVDISFRVKPVSGGKTVTIEVRPPDRAALIISRTVPAVISSMNVL